MENNHHLSYIRNSLRFLIICNRKITGVKRLANNDYVGLQRNLGKKRLGLLQLRMLVTKVDAGMIPGMLAVNRQRTGDLLLGVIFQRSKFNSVGTRNFWMLR